MTRTGSWVVVVLAAGCGHIGFDPQAGDDGGDDGVVTERMEWAKVAVGDASSCGITEAGQLWCWGRGTGGLLATGETPLAGAPARVGTDTDWTAVSIGAAHACGLRGEGQLWCWGSNARGALGAGPLDAIAATPIRVEGAWSEIATGDTFTCGIQRDDSLWCWGANDLGQAGVGGATGDVLLPTAIGGAWRTVATGVASACAIRRDDSLWCWGLNGRGQLGDATTESRPQPVPIAAGRTWLAVAVSFLHTCAIDRAGVGWCWGVGASGRLGTGDENPSLVPARLSLANASLATLSIGAAHACATTTDHAVVCWGASVHGGVPGVTAGAVTTPMRLAGASARSVHAGGDTTCAVDLDAHLACSGANSFGQAATPRGPLGGLERADDRSDWRAIFAHTSHACGTTADGMLRCWGTGSRGELGDNMYLDRQDPAEVGVGFADVAVNETATAALRGTELWSWGDAFVGGESSPTPAMIAPGMRDVALGEFHGCSLASGGSLTCGGVNVFGQLGDGTFDDRTAIQVAGTWRSVIAGSLATCATRTDGGLTDRLFCWGLREMVGSEAAENVNVPTPVVLPQLEVAAVGLGHTFGCALAGGQLWCWGDNYFGQLGTSTGMSSAEPVRIGLRTDWTAISTGGGHACAIARDRSLWCWGSGEHGQLGPPIALRRPPTQLGADRTWAAVAAGDRFTCAIATDGTRWCAGDNTRGQLGDGRSWLTALTPMP